ncbi:MAG: helix-turn-helix transcriptional regulator [Anaerolineaceae bacterium]|nr:helix-turn-helix transcriptional regulator [Anaerolineaceae bacterium]
MGAHENTSQELRRGILILAILSQLEEEQYGYSLIKRLSEFGLEIEQGTLYPLLRRLESKKLLNSDWRVEGSRPRRYYVINEDGKELRETLTREWKQMVLVMEGILT